MPSITDKKYRETFLSILESMPIKNENRGLYEAIVRGYRVITEGTQTTIDSANLASDFYHAVLDYIANSRVLFESDHEAGKTLLLMSKLVKVGKYKVHLCWEYPVYVRGAFMADNGYDTIEFNLAQFVPRSAIYTSFALFLLPSLVVPKTLVALREILREQVLEHMNDIVDTFLHEVRHLVDTRRAHQNNLIIDDGISGDRSLKKMEENYFNSPTEKNAYFDSMLRRIVEMWAKSINGPELFERAYNIWTSQREYKRLKPDAKKRSVRELYKLCDTVSEVPYDTSLDYRPITELIDYVVGHCGPRNIIEEGDISEVASCLIDLADAVLSTEKYHDDPRMLRLKEYLESEGTPELETIGGILGVHPPRSTIGSGGVLEPYLYGKTGNMQPVDAELSVRLGKIVEEHGLSTPLIRYI